MMSSGCGTRAESASTIASISAWTRAMSTASPPPPSVPPVGLVQDPTASPSAATYSKFGRSRRHSPLTRSSPARSLLAKSVLIVRRSRMRSSAVKPRLKVSLRMEFLNRTNGNPSPRSASECTISGPYSMRSSRMTIASSGSCCSSRSSPVTDSCRYSCSVALLSA